MLGRWHLSSFTWHLIYNWLLTYSYIFQQGFCLYFPCFSCYLSALISAYLAWNCRTVWVKVQLPWKCSIHLAVLILLNVKISCFFSRPFFSTLHSLHPSRVLRKSIGIMVSSTSPWIYFSTVFENLFFCGYFVLITYFDITIQEVIFWKKSFLKKIPKASEIIFIPVFS